MDRETKVKDKKKKKNETNLPEGWKRVRLREVIEIFDNQRIPLDSEYRSTIKGYIPYCGATGVIDYINDYIFDGEYVLIAEDGGKFNRFEETAYIMMGKFWANNHVHIVRGKDGTLDDSFLMYSVNYQDISYYISGSTREKLNQQLLKSVVIILPPLPEQHKIAEILETVDNAIEKTGRIIEKYKRIKQGLMQDLLTRGIVESDELGVMSYELRDEKKHRFKDSPLGRIPEEWEVVELGEVVESFAGGTPNRENKEFFSGSIKWLKSGEINRKYIYDTEEKITMKGFKFSSTKWIERNTVVIALYGATAGQVGIVKDKMTMNQAVLALNTFKNKLNYEYIYYYLSAYVPKILSQLQGSGQPNLSKKIIDTIQIPLPPLPEQHRIASILSQIDEAIEKEQEYKEKLERIKRGLMEDLLTGKVRVLGVMNYELGVKS